MEKHKICCCDVIDGLRGLESGSADIIIADPPYNIGKDFGNNTDKKEMGEYREWCKEWIGECIRVLKDNGTMFIYGFSEILAYIFVDIEISKRWLIWHYVNKNVATLHFWQRSHEGIICCWKGEPVFNRDLVREPYTENFLNNAAGKKRKASTSRYGNGSKETTYNAHANGALPRDVIKVPTLAGGNGGEVWCKCRTCGVIFNSLDKDDHDGHDIVKHPTQKPLELCKRLIKSCMIKGDCLVVVPFVGSGSELAAANELGVRCVGFDINGEYLEIARHRIGDGIKYNKPEVIEDGLFN